MMQLLRVAVIVPSLILTACQHGAPPVPAGDSSPQDAEATAVRRTVERNFPQIAYCYEKALRRDPSLEGRMEVEWEVEQGRVTRTQVVRNDLNDARFESCVTRSIERWWFPASVEGKILYPFLFKARKDSSAG